MKGAAKLLGLTARTVVLLGVLTLPVWPMTVSAQGSASVRITSPRDGTALRGPQVEVAVQIQGLRTVDAGTEPRPGEGHAHILIDQEVPKPGDPVPTAEGYVHMGTAPYDRRTIELAPGQHTITAVLGDSTHKVLDPPATHSITITVTEQTTAHPTRAADTGDGSLADTGPRAAFWVIVVLGGLAILRRAVAARP